MVALLAIESSCDETAAAVVYDGRRIGSNVIASQIDLHSPYGGVFPEVAARAHLEAIGVVVAQALDEADATPAQIDAVAVTSGPGLAGSLLVGVNFAKGLAFGWEKPLIGVNHIEGHIYSLWLDENAPDIEFPVLCLIVSGGHTELILMRGHGDYTLIGQTLDDAAGEAFDKVGRLLGLPYPGGPAIDRAAKAGDPKAFAFSRAMQPDSANFSFSGLKTAVLRAVQAPPELVNGKRVRGAEGMDATTLRPDVHVSDVAASFQAAAIDQLVDKTVRAAQTHHVTEILMAGGVSANSLLRREMQRRTALPVRYPPLALCTDNAAMIGAAGYIHYMAGQRDDWTLDVQPMAQLIAL